MVEKETEVCCAHCDKNYGIELPKPSAVLDHLLECHREAYKPFSRILNSNIRLQEVRVVSHELMEALRRSEEES